MDLPDVKAIAPWFGSNRMLAKQAGAAMGRRDWIGVPFGGGLSELLYLDARTFMVSDLHRHIVNLARVAADPELGPRLARTLRRVPFHEVELLDAQDHAAALHPPDLDELNSAEGREITLASAIDYFISVWMGRSAKAGTSSEFKGKLAVRWEASGGDSATRYRSAISSLKDWRRVLRRCQFLCLDVFEFLPKCKDLTENGIYVDPPFDLTGQHYRHDFTDEQHRRLAAELVKLQNARVVVRAYDTQLIRELYRDADWSRTVLTGRKQTNEFCEEVLLVRGG